MRNILYGAMALDLQRRGIDAVEVTGYDEKTVGTGYCDTCYYEYAVVIIEYTDSEGAALTATISESFAEYIRYLTD